MKIVYNPPYDAEWGASLTPWQRSTLAELHRQGKHLPDRTNHGSDWRWCQAGVRYKDDWGKWVRNKRGKGLHESVLIARTDYGYIVTSIRRIEVFMVDPATGEHREQEGWTVVERWYVSAEQSANYPPGQPRRRKLAA